MNARLASAAQTLSCKPRAQLFTGAAPDELAKQRKLFRFARGARPRADAEAAA